MADVYFSSVSNPRLQVWAARLSRMPRWGWIVVLVAVGVPLAVLLLSFAFVAIAIAIVATVVVAGIVAVRNMIVSLAGGSERGLAVRHTVPTRENVRVTVERVDVIDATARVVK